MRIALTGSEISDKAVRSIVKTIVDRGIDNGCFGYQNLSAKETAQGIANYLRPSFDKFLKEEEFITDILGKLDEKEAKLWKAQSYPGPIRNLIGYIRKNQYTKVLKTPNYEKVCGEHVSMLDNYFDGYINAPKKKYPTTVQTIRAKFLDNPNLSPEEGGRKFDKYSNYYIDKIFEMVKEKLAQ